MAAKKNNIKKKSISSNKSKAGPLKKGKAASPEKEETLQLKKKKAALPKEKEPASPGRRSKAKKSSLKRVKVKTSKAKTSKAESVKAVPKKRTRAAAKGIKKPVPVVKTKESGAKKSAVSIKKQKMVSPKKEVLAPQKTETAAAPAIKAEPVPEIKKKLPQGKKKNVEVAGRKEENASWKFFEKNGSVLIKIYTESEAIFSKLARIQGIQKSAKYFIKGRQVGADFIVPLDMAESVCSIAGVKIPKITIRKPE